jgi:hypothetical protein
VPIRGSGFSSVGKGAAKSLTNITGMSHFVMAVFRHPFDRISPRN